MFVLVPSLTDDSLLSNRTVTLFNVIIIVLNDSANLQFLSLSFIHAVVSACEDMFVKLRTVSIRKAYNYHGETLLAQDKCGEAIKCLEESQTRE